MTGAEVVWVDGVDGVEAVVIRYAQTGRLRAVNASSFLSCKGFDEFVTAVITADAVRALTLQRGEDAIAIVKSTEDDCAPK